MSNIKEDVENEINKSVNEHLLESFDGSKWAQIHEIIEALDALPDFWKKIATAENIRRNWKKMFVRRKIKRFKVKGFPLFASLEMEDGNGKLIRVYKREDSFSAEDFQQAAMYHGNKTVHHAKMAKHYADGYEEATGIQMLLPFDPDDLVD